MTNNNNQLHGMAAKPLQTHPTAKDTPNMVNSQLISSEPATVKQLSNPQLLQVYLSLAVIAHYACLSFNGYPADLGYWFNWISQLSTQGYLSLNANYPPMYIHWIYAVSKIVPAVGVLLENNLLLKALFELPNLLCHLALIGMVGSVLEKMKISRHQRHIIFMLTALNPAVLFNGPVWGQVDLIPVTFALAALLLHFSARFAVLSIPFYVVALLTKFQMICFAPVMGILFFRQIKTSLIGLIIAAGVFTAAFAPFILNHQFILYFKQAYINTLGEYAFTTLNASNLWMLVTGNTAPDSYPIFTLLKGTAHEKIISAKHFGMGLFALTSLCVFLAGIHSQWSKQLGDRNTELGQIIFYALICALAFFTLLPAMHERYLFPAVVMALAYSAFNPKRVIYGVIVSLICFVNMFLINGVNGSDVWKGLSMLMVATFAYSLIEWMSGRTLYIFIKDVFYKVATLKFFGVWVLLGVSFLFMNGLIHQFKIWDVDLQKNQLLLTTLTPSSATQTHGSLQLNRSFDNRPLSIGGKRFVNGFGTHTFSNIIFMLPPDAKSFSFMAGIDDEVGNTDMQFAVWGDGKMLWQSPVYHGFEDNKVFTVDVAGVKELSLRVEPVTDMQFDHADWINPVITFDKDIR